MKSARTRSSDELSLGEGITRRAWKHKGTHTRAHTHHTRAHPSKGVLLLFLERPGVTGTAANETLPDSRHGTLRWSRTRTELFPRLLPLTLCCGSRLRSTGVRRHCRSRADVARPWSPQNFRRRLLLHDISCWNPVPNRDGTGRPWSAISWTRLASPAHSGQRPLEGRDS